jgi:hypothetical protein
MKVISKVFIVMAYTGDFYEHKERYVLSVHAKEESAKRHSRNFNRRVGAIKTNRRSSVFSQPLYLG